MDFWQKKFPEKIYELNYDKLTENQEPVDFALKALSLGVGEILINSIDNDGSLLGYDIKMINSISKNLECPILALGGAGNWQHILDLFKLTKVTAACTQNIFHFTEESMISAKKFLKRNNIDIRI